MTFVTRFRSTATVMKRVLIGGTASIAALACSTTGDLDESHEDVDEVINSLGEEACKTTTVDDSMVIGSFCGEVGVDSPDEDYPYEQTDCTNQFLVEFTGAGVADADYPSEAGWAGAMPSTQSDCLAARWRYGVYDRGSLLVPQWDFRGSWKRKGAWNGPGGYCYWVNDSSTFTSFRTGISRIRIAANAFYNGGANVEARAGLTGPACE